MTSRSPFLHLVMGGRVRCDDLAPSWCVFDLEPRVLE